MTAKKPSYEDVLAARTRLEDNIADQVAQFEADYADVVEMKVSNVTATPRRAPSAEGDQNAWRGHVKIRLVL